MTAALLTSWLNGLSLWGPSLSAFGLILLAAQRAWVAYLKHRGADYVRAQAAYLVAESEPTIRMRELNVIDRMIDLGRLSLEVQHAEIALQEKLAAVTLEAATSSAVAASAQKAA